jgi:glutaconate CoA-transferase, subunit B
MTVTSIHPGVMRKEIDGNTGWTLKCAADAGETAMPSAEVLKVLGELHAHTKRAHGEEG